MKTIAVDAFLRWAWGQELPKAQAHTSFLRPDGFGFGWGSVGRYGRYMADPQEPDIRNRYGVTPDRMAQERPHPDALAAWSEVEALRGLTLTIPEGWDPIDEFDLGADGDTAIDLALKRLCSCEADGTLVLRRSAAEVVTRYAILGGAPAWEADAPVRHPVKAANGRPRWYAHETITANGEERVVEVDGFDARRRGPKAGAYLKFTYDPNPADAVEDRAEYEIWHAGLAVVCEALAGRLESHVVEPVALPARPWEDGAPAAPLILADLAPQPAIRRDRRPLAGPSPKRGITRESTGSHLVDPQGA